MSALLGARLHMSAPLGARLHMTAPLGASFRHHIAKRNVVRSPILTIGIIEPFLYSRQFRKSENMHLYYPKYVFEIN